MIAKSIGVLLIALFGWGLYDSFEIYRQASTKGTVVIEQTENVSKSIDCPNRVIIYSNGANVATAKADQGQVRQYCTDDRQK